MTWIAEFLDYQEAEDRRRAVAAVARAIYPTPWGAHTLRNERGYSFIHDGYPHSSAGYAEMAFSTLEQRHPRLR